MVSVAHMSAGGSSRASTFKRVWTICHWYPVMHKAVPRQTDPVCLKCVILGISSGSLQVHSSDQPFYLRPELVQHEKRTVLPSDHTHAM